MSSPVLISAQLPEAVWRQPISDPKTGLVDPKGLWGQQLRFLPVLAQATIALLGTHAQRLQTPAANYQLGSVFFETDRRLAYVQITGVWIYAYGMYPVLQANLPNDLGDQDIGLIAFVTDFGHGLYWQGQANRWTWAPGDSGSGGTSDFSNANQAPDANRWHLCDGSQGVAYLLSDGSLDYANLPNTAGLYFRI